MEQKIVWLLIDSNKYSFEHLHGVGRYLKDAQIVEKYVHFSHIPFLPNFLRVLFKPFLTQKSFQTLLDQEPPDIILSAGKKLAPVNAWLKKIYPSAYSIHLFRPRLPLKYFDKIALPLHDKMSSNKKVIAYYGETHTLTPERIEAAKTRWEKKFKRLNSPRIGVIVGNATSKQPFTADDARQFAVDMNQLKEKMNASLLVATSRKTPRKQTVILKRWLKHDFFYTPKDKGEPPYRGIYGWADILIVASPTILILSKVASVHKPLFIWKSPGLLSDRSHKASKEKLFKEMLIEMGIAKPFSPDLKPFSPEKFPNSTKEIAQLIEADLIIQKSSNSS